MFLGLKQIEDGQVSKVLFVPVLVVAINLLLLKQTKNCYGLTDLIQYIKYLDFN